MRHRGQWASGEKAAQICCHVTASPTAWIFPEEMPKAWGQLGEFRGKLEAGLFAPQTTLGTERSL